MSKEILYFIDRDTYYFVKDYTLRYVDFNEGFESKTSNLPVGDIDTLSSIFEEPFEFIDFGEFEQRKLTYVTSNNQSIE